MKWQAHEVTGLENDMFRKWQVDEMTGLGNGRLMKWQFVEMIEQWDDRLMKWHDEMTHWWIPQVNKITGIGNKKNDEMTGW